jgi:hypothetical protein
VGKQNVASSPDAFSHSLTGNFIDALSTFKQHAPTVHVRSADELNALCRKLVRAWTVLAVIAIFHKQRSRRLQFSDRHLFPFTRHNPAPLGLL